LKEGVVVLRDTKNGKDRLVPFSASLGEVLADYKVHYRDKIDNSNLFFIKMNGEPVNRGTVYKQFRKILRCADIPHGGKGSGPRVQDFRHSFSVHSLHKMATGGLDIYYCLPILSQYLGHQSIDATNHYIRIIWELYPEMMEKLNYSYIHLFPT